MAVDNDEDSAATRKKQLIGELVKARDDAHRSARRFEVHIGFAFWSSTALGLASTVLGLWFRNGIASGILAAVATGIAALPKLANFRPRANWWYAVRDTADKFRSRLVYELPTEVTFDQVAAIAQEWTAARTGLGTRMSQINSDTHN